MNTPPLIYIAGPFTGPTSWDIAQNVREAERYGLLVAEAGGFPVIPHANTHLFHGQLTADFWYAGTLALMRACHGVFLCPRWHESKGARAEAEEAHRNEMPVLALTADQCVDNANEPSRAIKDFIAYVRTRYVRSVT